MLPIHRRASTFAIDALCPKAGLLISCAFLLNAKYIGRKTFAKSAPKHFLRGNFSLNAAVYVFAGH